MLPSLSLARSVSLLPRFSSLLRFVLRAFAQGYSIRLESRASPDTALLFCTNGVLLRRLTLAKGGAAAGLDGITHICVDEIHERDQFADFLLIVLREVLPRLPNLRLVLMSATINEDLFSNYFGGAPTIRVPGFTHPVTDFFLEDALLFCGYKPTGAGAAASGARRLAPAPPQPGTPEHVRSLPPT